MQLLPCQWLAREQLTVILSLLCLDSFIRLFQGLGINILVFELAVKQKLQCKLNKRKKLKCCTLNLLRRKVKWKLFYDTQTMVVSALCP